MRQKAQELGRLQHRIFMSRWVGSGQILQSSLYQTELLIVTLLLYVLHNHENAADVYQLGCPMHVKENGSCPVKPSDDGHSSISKLNPLNYMPNLPQTRASNQIIHLPVERETSSIPRGDSQTNWEYPSPQQMYNAMLRKGYDDTPQDAVESMVAVHNFLNEGAWAEIVEWEQTFSQGLIEGWRRCYRYSAEVDTSRDTNITGRTEQSEAQQSIPKLLRFQGRPKDMTPRATILQLLGQVYPSKYK